PPVAAGIVVFGYGYAVDLLLAADWLGRCQLYYWGDIDTHGFVILDRLRAAFPNAASFLMDRSTLSEHTKQWTREPAPHIGSLERLTPQELSLFDDLRFDRLAQGVRLEQERISFALVMAAVQAITRSNNSEFNITTIEN